MSDVQVVQWRTDEGVNSAILFKRTRGKLYLIPMVGFYPFSTIKIYKVPLSEQVWITPLLTRKGRPYPLKKAVRRFLSAHKRFGGTVSAKRQLKELIE